MKLNEALIDMIQENTPGHTNPAAVLCDTLAIGREAAYRRLRGDVLFSFSEAALLSARLNFSLDRTMGRVGAGNVLFQLSFSDFYSTLEKYGALLEKDIAFLSNASLDPTAAMATAGSTIPPEFYMRYEHMSNFKFFKWVYQNGMFDPSVRCLGDMQVPPGLRHIYQGYVRGVEALASTTYVFDGTCFKRWVSAIRTFRAMHLISDEDVKALTQELFLLLEETESIAQRGANRNGNKVSFYLSEIDLESSYSYISTSNRKASCLGVFSLNSLRTLDPTMFSLVEQWVKAQSRFSTLISQSGELQRVRYFKRQREILSELEREGIMPSLESAQD